MQRKESKKINKFLDHARELKNPWNMKVMVIPIVIGALGKVSKILKKRLEKLEIKERINTIQTTALFRSARILRRILEA